MSYKLIKEEKIKKLTYLSCDFKGIELKPKKLNRKNMISASKIIITCEEYKKNYVRRMVNTRLKKIYAMIFDILNDEDAGSSDVVNVLGELERLQGIIERKYEEVLEMEEIELINKKIELLKVELKRKIVDIRVNEMFKTNTNIYSYDKNQNKSR